jgi:hypothetical protein
MCELNKTQIISPQTPSFKCPLAYILFILRIALSLGLYKICLNMRSHKEKMVESSEKKNDQGTKNILATKSYFEYR